MIVVVVLAIVLAIVLKGGDKVSETPSNTDSLASTSASAANGGASSTGAASTKQVNTAKPTTAKPVVAAPKMTATGAYIVYYTSSGFSPASLSLVRGAASVHFVNNSSGALRIAPVDTRNKPYAEFSQSKSVGYGGTFDYTFTTAGSYGYYNENNKVHQAIISVQ